MNNERRFSFLLGCGVSKLGIQICKNASVSKIIDQGFRIRMLMRRLVQKRLGHYLIQNTTFVASCDADRAQIESGLQMSDSTIIRQRQSNKITAYISMSFGSYTCPFVLSNQFQYKNY